MNGESVCLELENYLRLLLLCLCLARALIVRRIAVDLGASTVVCLALYSVLVALSAELSCD